MKPPRSIVRLVQAGLRAKGLRRLEPLARNAYIRTVYGHDLPGLMTLFGSDKHGRHFYAQHYARHFESLRNKAVTLLEIGIGGYDDPAAGGASLRAWKAFFPHGRIVGLDIHDKKGVEEERIQTFCGSQTDEIFLASIIDTIGAPDIIIDDGSHLSRDVIATFRVLFPRLAPDGIYAVEDLQTSYWTTVAGQEWDGAKELDAPHTSMTFFKTLVDGLNHEEFMLDAYTPSYFDEHIVGMHFYHNLLIVQKGLNAEGSHLLGRKPRLVRA